MEVGVSAWAIPNQKDPHFPHREQGCFFSLVLTPVHQPWPIYRTGVLGETLERFHVGLIDDTNQVDSRRVLECNGKALVSSLSNDPWDSCQT